jgi:hypothetical protein
MRRLMALFIGIVIGGGGVYFAYQYHVVRTDDEWLFIPKTERDLANTYIDIRRWSVNDWAGQPELARALVKEGRSDLIVQPQAGNLFDELLRPFRSRSVPDPAAERR